MPYIHQEVRDRIDAGGAIYSPGELSYAITKLVTNYVSGPQRYFTYAVVVGVLVLTTIEFIRRVIFPYEDEKRIRNGDVYITKRTERP